MLLSAIIAAHHRTTPPPPSAPTLVQQVVSLGNAGSASSYTLSLPAAPTSGNVLAVCVDRKDSTDTVTMPSGWTQVASATLSTGRVVDLWSKTSDGTETSVLVDPAISTSHACCLQEWPAGTTFGGLTVGRLTGLTTSATMGPSAAPTGTATPAFFGYYDGPGPTTTTWPTGWTGAGPNTGGSGFPYYEAVCGAATTGSSTAVSVTLTKPTRGTTMDWASYWAYGS